VQNLSIWK